MKSCVNKIFLKPYGVKLYAKDVKYDLLSALPTNTVFQVNFPINAVFEHLRMPCLLGGGV